MKTPLVTLAIAGSLLWLAACGSPSGGSSAPSGASPASSAAALATQTSASPAYGDSGYSYPSASAPSPSASNGAQGPLVAVAQNPKLGAVLTDARGMTAYTFKKDEADESYCTGPCATTWPPVTAASGAPPVVSGLTGKFTVLSRDDGSKQLVYNGKPLYTYSGDKTSGDANGQGIGGQWFAATP